MPKKRGNRPLMIYTSLIFVVAIILVIISFFGLKHQDEQMAKTQSISERATIVSAKNAELTKENEELLSKNTLLSDEIKTLTEQNEALTKESEYNIKLNEVYTLIDSRKKKQAYALLQEISTEDLTNYQKTYFDSLVKKCKD